MIKWIFLVFLDPQHILFININLANPAFNTEHQLKIVGYNCYSITQSKIWCIWAWLSEYDPQKTMGCNCLSMSYQINCNGKKVLVGHSLFVLPFICYLYTLVVRRHQMPTQENNPKVIARLDVKAVAGEIRISCIMDGETMIQVRGRESHQQDTKVRRGNRCFTHRKRMTHICVNKLTIIGSDTGLSPGRRQGIIRTNVGI